MRALGHGQRVLFVQFVKADPSTREVACARDMPRLRLLQTGRGFVPRADDPAFAAHRQAACEGLAVVEKALLAGDAELVVLDEVCVAIARHLLDVEAVRAVIAGARPGTNVVLTGRDAPAELIEAADTVTRMGAVKHALAEGRAADVGVEW